MFSRREFLAGSAALFGAAGCTATGSTTTISSVNGMLVAPRGEEFPVQPVSLARIPPQFHRQVVRNPTGEPAGTIVVDPNQKFLYLVLNDRRAMRYGIGVGRAGFGWSGEAVIKAKRRWPAWHPPKEMQERDPLAAKWADGMPGGPSNPIGARGLYLFQGNKDTLYRIHGTAEVNSIGRAVSSGCIRLLNADVIDLYDRVPIGTRVVVRGSRGEVMAEAARDIGADLGEAARSIGDSLRRVIDGQPI
ncbi:MAG TPA: L,D-transpeptidase [Afifellaceae bacterium]|nr:L,D-transpeptidase [Afifellaceae bacterium]